MMLSLKAVQDSCWPAQQMLNTVNLRLLNAVLPIRLQHTKQITFSTKCRKGYYLGIVT